MTGMEVEAEVEEEVVVVGAMVLIGLEDAIGIVVLEEDQVMTARIRTILVPMNIAVQETSIRGRKNTLDRAIGGTAVTCWSCQSLFCCISSSWFSGWTNLLDQSVDVQTLAKRFNCLMSVNARSDVLV
ncbi:hypothetical protein NL676_039394 [Syzygium grande]|nr:hypothetical protein NL676_039394 [Syzygium grande]